MISVKWLVISGCMENKRLEALAEGWIGYWLAPYNSPERAAYDWVTDQVYDLTYEEDPELLWQLVLAVHRRDRSIQIMQVLSAGPLEDLLARHGERFIVLVEVEARRDPTFASLLGGVWKNAMSDAIWERVQGVWDRRGWDGISQ